MTPRRLALALAAGLALADASIVTLALPELLADFSTTIPGVGAVIFVYTALLALTLIPAERAMRSFGPRQVGGVGFALFAVASLACGLANSLALLLVFRGVQAVGGAAGLVAAFALLTGKGHEGVSARTLWLLVAVLSAAIGPALGGALTQAFSWEAIFLAQVPLAALAAIASFGAIEPRPVAEETAEARSWPAGIALAFVSAALTAVLFLLVLLLVAGWGVEPLRAAVAVTVLPIAALAGSRIGGPAQLRAAAGCLLVGGGTLALAFLPDASLGWTVVPQLVAGVGMGLALPALGGELLPERTPADAAWLLTMRHVGIAVAIVPLALIIADQLDLATERARERGVALVLDAQLPPTDKLSLAPDLLSGVNAEQPRAGLRDALDAQVDRYDAGTKERAVLEELGVRADDTLVAAVGESFLFAFLITGGLAIVGGLLLLPGARQPGWAAAAIAVGAAAIAFTAIERTQVAPEKVAIKDPCEDRAGPEADGITGFLQDRALDQIDKSACKIGATREEYVLALADPAEAEAFTERYGVDPRSTQGILDALLG